MARLPNESRSRGVHQVGSARLGLREFASHLQAKKLRSDFVGSVELGKSDDFGDRVVALRSRLGLTQRQFAQKYGLELKTIRNWEQGVRKPEAAAQRFIDVIENAPEFVGKILGRINGSK